MIDLKKFSYLLPICYLRWSLIMLNDFLKEDSNRRNFPILNTKAKKPS